MALDFSPTFERLLAQEIASSGFASAEQLLTEALRLLSERRSHASADEGFRHALEEAAECLKAGTFFDAEDVFDQLDVGLNEVDLQQWPNPPYLCSELARKDLADLKSFLLANAGVRATRFVLRGLEASMRFIATESVAAGTGQLTGHLRLGQWPAFSYVIVYEVESNPLRVARILRDPCSDLPTILAAHRPR